MPQQVRALRVFIAGPADVQKELDVVRKVLTVVNTEAGQFKNLRLEGFDWMTNVAGGSGRAEDVILKQIQPEDLFVGVMWHRAGTPTGRYPSGTIEEYELAYRAWRRSGAEVNGRPRILFYFCERPYFPRSVADLEQALLVTQFRESVQRRGLSACFSGQREFENMLRRDLTTVVRQWRPGSPQRGVRPFRKDGSPRWRNCRAVLVADIQGFQQLNVDVGVAHCDRICDLYQRVGRGVVRSLSGALLSGVGDHIWAVFETCALAVRAAVELLRQLQDPTNGVLPTELPVRVALHASELIATASEPMEPYSQARLTTSLACRVGGGHIIATGAFRQELDKEPGGIDRYLDVRWHDHGDVEVDGQLLRVHELIDLESAVEVVPLAERKAKAPGAAAS